MWSGLVNWAMNGWGVIRQVSMMGLFCVRKGGYIKMNKALVQWAYDLTSDDNRAAAYKASSGAFFMGMKNGFAVSRIVVDEILANWDTYSKLDFHWYVCICIYVL